MEDTKLRCEALKSAIDKATQRVLESDNPYVTPRLYVDYNMYNEVCFNPSFKATVSVNGCIIRPVGMSTKYGLASIEPEGCYYNENNRTFTVKWSDGTVTYATCTENDEPDFRVGFALCLAKKQHEHLSSYVRNLDVKIVKKKGKKNEKTEQHRKPKTSQKGN